MISAMVMPIAAVAAAAAANPMANIEAALAASSAQRTLTDETSESRLTTVLFEGRRAGWQIIADHSL